MGTCIGTSAIGGYASLRAVQYRMYPISSTQGVMSAGVYIYRNHALFDDKS